MIWLYIFSSLLLILVIILAVHIRIKLEIEVITVDDKLKMKLYFKIVNKQVEQEYLVDLDPFLLMLNSYINDNSDKETRGRQIIKDYVKRLASIQKDINDFYYYLQHSQVDDLVWVSTIAFEDAAKTGLYSGVLWAFKGTFLSILSSICKLNKFQIEVNPNFANTTSSVINSEFTCILRIRIVHIMFISISIFFAKVWGYCNGSRTTATSRASY
ncbi:MAG TPA: DUF2953 domain-containing protein [Syntrophomonadaceae bacterium]|nr:DUF2953 domain-containing protein [Syntrophomonadaceae bacterium]